MHADLQPEDITCLIDTREQTPFDIKPLKCERATLDTGDYTVKGLEHVIAVERKSLADLLGCIGNDRDRFEREMQRILAYPIRLLVVDTPWHTVVAGMYARSRVTPAAVTGSLLGWMASGIPMIFAMNHDEAGWQVSRFLFIAARRRWREARAFCDTLKIAT